MSRRDTLKRELLRFIAEGSSATFDALALDVARYQRDSLPAYGALVRANGKELNHWRDAPFVPTEILREIDLSPTDLQADAVFLTSGTTGVGRQGMRRVPDLELYHAGCRTPFIEGVLATHEEPIPWLSLIRHSRRFPTVLSPTRSPICKELLERLWANADGLLITDSRRDGGMAYGITSLSTLDHLFRLGATFRDPGKPSPSPVRKLNDAYRRI